MEQINQVILIVGRRGSGKTDYTRSLMAASSLKKLVVDTLAHPKYADLPRISPEQVKRWRSGNYKMFGSNFAEMWSALQTVKNSLVVLEDATKYIKSTTSLPDDVVAFLVDSKQNNNHVVIIYHGFGMVPRDLFRLCDIIVCFKTNEVLNEYRRKIPNFPAVAAAYARVEKSRNNYAREEVLIS